MAATDVQGTPAEALALLEEAREVPVPYQGSDYVCPSCEQPIPTRKQIRMAKPAKYEHALHDVLKCPWCNFIFSPRQTATVLSK